MQRKQSSAKPGWEFKQSIARRIAKLYRRVKTAVREGLGAWPPTAWQPARVPAPANDKTAIRRTGASNRGINL